MRHTPGRAEEWRQFSCNQFYDYCRICMAYREIHVSENSDSKGPWKITIVSATGQIAPVPSPSCFPDLAKVDNW